MGNKAQKPEATMKQSFVFREPKSVYLWQKSGFQGHEKRNAVGKADDVQMISGTWKH